MKFTFSTKNVSAESFLALCNKASDYGFSGFEIYDVDAEIAAHSDTIFNSLGHDSAKRKLHNRHISVSALTYPETITSSTDANAIKKYVSQASFVGAEHVIIRPDDGITGSELKEVLTPALKLAVKLSISILLETYGALANTEKMLEIINVFETTALGVSWNIRETYFTGNEQADTTIQNLGAYINHVRIGDRKNGCRNEAGRHKRARAFHQLPKGHYNSHRHQANPLQARPYLAQARYFAGVYRRMSQAGNKHNCARYGNGRCVRRKPPRMVRRYEHRRGARGNLFLARKRRIPQGVYRLRPLYS